MELKWDKTPSLTSQWQVPGALDLIATQQLECTIKNRNNCYHPAAWHLDDCIMLTRRRQWHPTPVLLLGKSNGRRSLVGCSPWGRWESDTTERLHFHFSLWCIGEGNGNTLQCSCLENPRDGGAWWAAVSGVAQSRTRLKQLSSSTSKEWENILLYTSIHHLDKVSINLPSVDLYIFKLLSVCEYWVTVWLFLFIWLV